MNRDLIEEMVRKSIDRLIKEDSHLLIIDVNERTISHRLALYLQKEFEDWNVDCEYNRNIDTTKMLNLSKRIQIPIEEVPPDDTEGKTVFPDIIVHHRGTDDNLLVIEMKKTSSNVPRGFDLIKLEAFGEQLGYVYRLFLCFNVGSDYLKEPEIVWV